MAGIAFIGVNNISDPAKLPEGMLKSAINVDFSAAGSITLRDELTQVSSTATHSFYECEGKLYGVQNRILTLFDSALLPYPIKALKSNKQMSYALGNNGTILYTNGVDIGIISNGVVTDLPSPKAYETISATGETILTMAAQLPAGEIVDYFNGRFFVASSIDGDTLISYSDAYTTDVKDTENFFYHRGTPTMLASTDDTLWFSSGSCIVAYTGGLGGQIRETRMSNDYGAIVGTSVVMDGTRLKLEGVTGKVIFVTTNKGVCMLMNQGQILNLSKKSYSVPVAEYGSAGIVESKGYSRYMCNLSNTSQSYNNY